MARGESQSFDSGEGCFVGSAVLKEAYLLSKSWIHIESTWITENNYTSIYA